MKSVGSISSTVRNLRVSQLAALELPRFGGRVRTAVDRRQRGTLFRPGGPRLWTHAGA